ncbi:MAG TPA: ribbon-helix-helix domain-containing protein [Actinomycetales bacterium]|nr:ribbon-helix-helix domain-containing protein [Actinomycetales bacterium]
MKVSVSLPTEDVAFLDAYAREHGASRSAVVLRAVRLLRSDGLGADYDSAWQEWSQTDGELWETTTGDGL